MTLAEISPPPPMAPPPVVGVWYALIMLAAIGTAWILSRWNQQPLPLRPRERWGIAIGAFCGSMIGAKIPYLLADWEGMLSGRAWLTDGKTILFGMVGGYLGVEVAKAVLDVRLKTGDTFAVPVAVGIALGRLACLQAGCCYGLPTSLPWGVSFGDGVPRHPTQLYEFAFHLVAAGGLFWLRSRGLFRGQLIKLYFLAYFAYRFLTEWLRPEPRFWPGLTFYQWSALACGVLFSVLWLHDARQQECGRN
jgi:phosphatidylglycerol:prolipoprotein diacylglycerol transferase